MESQPQNPEFRINPENFHPCSYEFHWVLRKAIPGGLLTSVKQAFDHPLAACSRQVCPYAQRTGFSQCGKFFVSYSLSFRHVTIMSTYFTAQDMLIVCTTTVTVSSMIIC